MNDEQSTMNDEQWLEIGKIIAAQGLKGEVRVYPYSDFPERFEVPGQRWIKQENSSKPEPIDLLQGRQLPGKKIYVVQLEGICDRNQAEGLKGCKLLVPESDRPTLAEDEFHVADLIGLQVFHYDTQEPVGVVVNVFSAGHDLLEVKLARQPSLVSPETVEKTSKNLSKGKKRSKKPKPVTVLIPFVKEVVPVVNLEQGCLEITPPSGLLELNTS